MKKGIKLTGIIISIIALPFLFILFNEKRNEIEEEKAAIGVYVFSFPFSELELKKQDSLIFTELTLRLNSDNTFEFSHSIPFIKGTKGSWDTEGYGMNDYIILTVENGYEYQMGNCCGKYNQTTISYPLSLDKENSSFGRLGFVKIDNDKSIK